MKKKLLLVVFVLFVVGTIGFIWFKHYAKTVKDEHCLTTQISSNIFDFNEFELQVSEKLNKNDFIVLDKNSGKIIYKNGKSQKGIKNQHGYCIFEIQYKKQKIYEIGHMKYNNWHTNSYVLKVDVNKNIIDLTLTIINRKIDNTLFYKRFSYSNSGELTSVIYLSDNKTIYNEEIIEK